MIFTSNQLLEKYSDYSDPFGKIRRLVKDGKLFVLKKGIYEDDRNASGAYHAAAIYGPSYLSFNYALSVHGLIPEAVYVFTSATTEKRKKKEHTNHFGTFTYRDIPLAAYPYGIKIIEENGYSYMLATAEKALCDKLYDMPVVKNQKELEHVLFDDMRVDRREFGKLSKEDILFIAPKYCSTNLNLLARYLKHE